MATAIAARKPEIKTALPGPNGRAIIEADAKWVNPAYPRPDFKLVAERAKGVWVEDVDGNIFLDCNAGVAVCSTGHCHPEVVSAIQDQAAQLIHMCGTDYYYRQMPELAQKLDQIVPISGPTRTHFANSGTEAVETALKLAMHATGREKFISFFGSFHGRTLGSLSLTSSKAAQRLGFKRQALDVVHLPYPNEYRNPFREDECDGGGAGQGCGQAARSACSSGVSGGRSSRARDNSGIKAGSHSYDYGCLAIVAGRQASRFYFCLLGVFPIVISCDESSAPIMKFQRWILQHVCQSNISQ
jgi:4-aminobutyrate aminotransferase